MKLVSKAFAVASLGFLIGQWCGCASSSNLVDLWHDPSFKAPLLEKILVVAVAKDATKRRIWEDAFTGEFAKYGVTATSSYSLFPGALPDTEKVIAAVQTNGFDGILVVTRLPSETTTQYVEGYTSTEPVVHYNSYSQRLWTFYREIDHPGYTDSQTVGIRSIEVTSTGNRSHLIWSAKSRTPDPGSVVDAQRGIAGLAVSELSRQSIIGSRKQ